MPTFVHQHLQHHPPKSAPNSTRPSISQKCACAVTSTFNSTPNSIPNCMPLAPYRRSCKIGPVTGMPAGTRLSISPSPQTAPQTAPQNSTYTSTPNCTPPSTSSSILHLTFPALLEVRTPTAFSYLGKNNRLCIFFFFSLSMCFFRGAMEAGRVGAQHPASRPAEDGAPALAHAVQRHLHLLRA